VQQPKSNGGQDTQVALHALEEVDFLRNGEQGRDRAHPPMTNLAQASPLLGAPGAPVPVEDHVPVLLLGAVRHDGSLTRLRKVKREWRDESRSVTSQPESSIKTVGINIPVQGRRNYNNRKPRIDYLKFENRFDLLKKKEKSLS
jgi:hypothetical protein